MATLMTHPETQFNDSWLVQLSRRLQEGLNAMVQVEGQIVAAKADEFVEKQRDLSTLSATVIVR